MAKHKYIETPQQLFELFEQYQTEVKGNPRKRHVFVGKDGNSENEKLERPLTMEGFRIFCFKNQGCIKHYFDNTDNRYDEYSTICSYIKDIIRNDQIEGGMVGQYNPSITQRLNGLVDKQAVENSGDITISFKD
jgi:hypothetical protein